MLYDISFVNCYGPLKQKLKISYLSNFVLARPSDAFLILSKEGHFISNTKEEGSHYLLLLDRPWTWPEAGKGRKRGLKMSAQPLRGFLAGTMQRKTCCCLISQVANLRFFCLFSCKKHVVVSFLKLPLSAVIINLKESLKNIWKKTR